MSDTIRPPTDRFDRVLPLKLAALPLLPDAERRQAPVTWNAPTTDSLNERCIHLLFEEQVERTPDDPALLFQGQTWSYAELNKRSNKLADRLLRVGVGQGTLVGLCVERCPEAVAAIIAVHKTGAAYVPIDPALPQGRLSYMVQDAGLRFLLTQEHLKGVLPPGPDHVLSLDGDWVSIGTWSTANPGVRLLPSDLAYVIYTSGTTGKPRGVLIEHRGIPNLAWSQIRAFGVQANDRVLQFASLSFDASVSEIWMALLAGATLCLAPAASLQPGPALERVLREQAISVVTLSPSILEVMPAGPYPALRSLIVAGEPCPAQLARTWSAGRRFFNAYGPTEGTVCATISDPLTGAGKPPIGRPMANTRAYVLDAQLQPVPVGVAGELHIGGVGLARGYLNRPALTAAKFIPDPFANSASRLYKTGDLCRWLPDGNLEFLGRLDEQVKIRGFRIELGEIEAALCRHPSVRKAVVVVCEEPAHSEDGQQHASRGKRLAAYVVAQPGSSPTGVDLRRFVKGILPDYMVPAAFITLAALPLNASGKVNRQALPAPTFTRTTDRAYVAPRTEVEQFLVEIWQEVLGIHPVGVHDDFFEMGGNSLQVALLVQKLQDKLREYVYTLTLFDAPTVAALAQYLRRNYATALARLFGTEPREGEEREGEAPAEPLEGEPWEGEAPAEPLSPGSAGASPSHASSGSAGTLPPHASPGSAGASPSRVDEHKVAALRQLIHVLPPKFCATQRQQEKNRRAAFILSPPRSGSTLFRVMLAGHPALFAPPELQLLNFNTLLQRRERFATDRDNFWLNGTVRALMAIAGWDAERAESYMVECERQGMSVQEFYALMQGWIGDRLFIDKTPFYSLDPATLNRAETDFHEARYLYLVRHPGAVIASFEEARLHLFFPSSFLKGDPGCSPRELAELIWTVSHQNILAFLKTIPPQRQHRVTFEELVRNPQPIMKGVASFLGVEFHPGMLEPYKETQARMTDPHHPMARMLGDVKFHEYKGIEAKTAELRKGRCPDEMLSPLTRNLAQSLGYTLAPAAGQALVGHSLVPLRSQPERSSRDAPQSERSSRDAPQSERSSRDAPPGQNTGSRLPFFCVHPAGGTVFCYRALAHHLGADQPVYAFESPGQRGWPRRIQLRTLAARYVQEMRTVQPAGPYVLGGWSMGGVIAFEMAQQLRAQGQQIALLALFDSDVPQPMDSPPKVSPERFLAEFAHQCSLEIPPGALEQLSPDARLVYLLEQAKQANAVPADLGIESFRLLYRQRFRLFRANVRALRGYVPTVYPDRLVLLQAADRSQTAPPGPRWDWHTLAPKLEVRVVPGDHFSMIREPHVRSLADLLHAYLQAVAETSR